MKSQFHPSYLFPNFHSPTLTRMICLIGPINLASQEVLAKVLNSKRAQILQKMKEWGSGKIKECDFWLSWLSFVSLCVRLGGWRRRKGEEIGEENGKWCNWINLKSFQISFLERGLNDEAGTRRVWGWLWWREEKSWGAARTTVMRSDRKQRQNGLTCPRLYDQIPSFLLP